ncbi:MAG TPA: hypothetical protein VND93_19730 [Myxococcales bacterium]|nr:hypothetical protein [Myxococcales bacterium]
MTPHIVSSPTHHLVVLEQNRAAGQRIGRIISAAANFSPVVVSDDLQEVTQALGRQDGLLCCDAKDVRAGVECARRAGATLLVWTRGPLTAEVEAALEDKSVDSVVAWPDFLSVPRPWELSMAVRRALNPRAVPRARDLLAWGASVFKWRPRSTEDRDRVVAEVGDWMRTLGVAPRQMDRVTEVTYELVMNAMYDAPVDAGGKPRYAFDRKRPIQLTEVEAPVVRLGSDGLLLVVEVTDPFGLLSRGHVVRGLLRGRRAGETDQGPVVDASHGGAGLGLFKVYSSSAALLTEVHHRQLTRVLSVHDLDVSPRDLRSLPCSLHLFDVPPSHDRTPTSPGHLSPEEMLV